jgi:hypothetical protein
MLPALTDYPGNLFLRGTDFVRKLAKVSLAGDVEILG